MCYGMGCEREFPDTGTCADPRRCPLYVPLPEPREKEPCGPRGLYCPGCEPRGRRCYLRFNRQDGFYCCDDCGEAHDRETLSDAYAAEAASPGRRSSGRRGVDSVEKYLFRLNEPLKGYTFQ